MLKELFASHAKSLIVIQEDQKRYRAIAMRIIERNRLLNRDAIEAAERAQRFIGSIGGLVALADMQRARELAEYERAQRPILEFLQRLEACWPGSWALQEMLQERHDLDKSDFIAAARRFARNLDPHSVDPKARRPLSQIAQREGKSSLSLLRQRFFPEALILVLNDADRPRPMRRFGGQWIKRRDGKKARVKPINRPWGEFIFWVRVETCKAASAIILGREYPVLSYDILKRSIPLDDEYRDDDETSPLEALLTDERRIQVEQQLLPALTRQEKNFFFLIESGASPSQLAISDQNVRQLLSRIRKKFLSISNR